MFISLLTTSATGVLVTVICAVALSGCSGDDKGDAATSAATSSAGAGGTGPAIGASPSPGATAPDLPVLGSHKTSDGRTPLQIDLNEVRVSGRVMTVTFTVRNLAGAGTTSSGWQVSEFFNDGIYQNLKDGSPEDGHTADGVYVVDAANAKRYLVARDPEGRCVCSNSLSSTFVGSGEGVALTGVFGAPPSTTTTIDVSVPHAGTFSGITISR